MKEVVTSSFLSWLLIFVILCINKATPQWVTQNDGVCRTPNGVRGSCINLRQCPPLVALLQQLTAESTDFLRRSQCGFEGRTPRVCCPNTATTGGGQPVTQPTTAVQVTPPDVTGHSSLRFLPQDICGPILGDRITNGELANLFEFPWMALISYNTRNGLRFRCGGSVINDRYILTAAHCISNLENGVTLAGVRLGEHNIDTLEDCEQLDADTRVCSPPVQDFSIARIIPHPQYSPRQLIHDIGLLRLRQRVNFNVDNVRPICLPIGNLRNEELNSRQLTVAGWGTTETGTSSPALLRVDIPVVPNQRCAVVYNRSTTIVPQQMCAGGSMGKDSCSGDSGGPLMTFGSLQGDTRFVQHGVVSFGPKVCGVEGRPGVYTRVAFYMDWILQNLRA